MCKIIESCLIFPEGEKYSECHASTILMTQKGTLISAWFGGTKEKNDDVAIWFSRNTTGKWVEQKKLADTEGVPCWNPVLFEFNDRIVLFFKSGKEIPSWQTFYCESSDDGISWSLPKELVPGDLGGRGPVKNKPIRLSDGSVLAPSSIETKEKWDCFTDRSEDEGHSWAKTDFIPIDHKNLLGLGIIQPSLFEDSDGNVRMLMRSSEGFLYESTSYDNGHSWKSAHKTDIPNNNSGIDLVKAENGHIYLVCNPVSENWGIRNPIVLMESSDDGRTFRTVLTLEFEKEDGKSANCEFSYPAVISYKNSLFITYTYKRRSIKFCKIDVK